MPCELLLALKVANITETQAAELLEAKSWESSVLDPGPQELVQCLAFLEAWQRELPGRNPAAEVEDFEPCRQLQEEARSLIDEAMAQAASLLPLPLYLRWKVQRLVSRAIS